MKIRTILSIIFIIIGFLFLPIIFKLIFNPSLPFVISISNSMAHEENFDQWWMEQKYTYNENEITKEQFKSFPLSKGFKAGDILIVKDTTYDNLKRGDVILFNTNRGIFTHRIIKKYQENEMNYLQTKGDNNYESQDVEKKIEEKQIIGKVIGRIPKMGKIKIWLINIFS
jgi:signal peptidase I